MLRPPSRSRPGPNRHSLRGELARPAGAKAYAGAANSWGARVWRLDDGRIMLTLKTAWADGTRALVFEPLELLEKLAALTPRPRINLVLYHGVLAPHAAWRARVVAYGAPPVETPAGPSASANGTAGSPATPRSRH